MFGWFSNFLKSRHDEDQEWIHFRQVEQAKHDARMKELEQQFQQVRAKRLSSLARSAFYHRSDRARVQRYEKAFSNLRQPDVQRVERHTSQASLPAILAGLREQETLRSLPAMPNYHSFYPSPVQTLTKQHYTDRLPNESLFQFIERCIPRFHASIGTRPTTIHYPLRSSLSEYDRQLLSMLPKQNQHKILFKEIVLVEDANLTYSILLEK